MKTIEAQLRADDKRFGIIASRYNNFITKRLLDGCVEELTRHGAGTDAITVVWVPGAFEIPLTAQYAAASKRYDALICLAAVLRGETPHYEYVSAECAKGVAQVSLAFSLPVIFGVITADTLEQAISRAGAKAGNKGEEAARTAIEMIQVLQALR